VRVDEIDIAGIAALEAEVWDALVSGDAAADERMLSDDFVGVYSTGFAGRSDHVEQLADGPTVAEYRVSDERLVVISPGAALYAYRADYRRPGAAEWETMFVSSLWCRRDGGWVNTFSQDTAASPYRTV